jgi:hypothetical protein
LASCLFFFLICGESGHQPLPAQMPRLRATGCASATSLSIKSEIWDAGKSVGESEGCLQTNGGHGRDGVAGILLVIHLLFAEGWNNMMTWSFMVIT